MFQPLQPSAGTITVCGESGVYPYTGSCWRDTDWYEITLDEQRAIEVCAFAEFPLQLLLLEGDVRHGNVRSELGLRQPVRARLHVRHA